MARRLDAAGPAAGPADEAQRARLAAVVDEAVDAYFTPARRARLSARLLDVAGHLSRSGAAPQAASAAAVARALAAGRPVAGIPFADQLVRRAFPAESRAV